MRRKMKGILKMIELVRSLVRVNNDLLNLWILVEVMLKIIVKSVSMRIMVKKFRVEVESGMLFLRIVILLLGIYLYMMSIIVELIKVEIVDLMCWDLLFVVIVVKDFDIC